jgi:hypothetical protein
MKTKDYIYYINIYHLTDQSLTDPYRPYLMTQQSAKMQLATHNQQSASQISLGYTLITHSIWYSCQCYLPINIYRLIGGDRYVFSAHHRII